MVKLDEKSSKVSRENVYKFKDTEFNLRIEKSPLYQVVV